jgi:hypothetical protein
MSPPSIWFHASFFRDLFFDPEEAEMPGVAPDSIKNEGI